ncbi:hypothetical protein AB0B79_12690 [Streptomyces sp. NPDC039022]
MTIRAAVGLLVAVALSGAVLPAVAHADSDDGAGSGARPASGSHGDSGAPSKSGFLFPVDGLAQNANVGVTSVSDHD